MLKNYWTRWRKTLRRQESSGNQVGLIRKSRTSIVLRVRNFHIVEDDGGWDGR
jgi:hypothetical protein